jgi:PAS domain S-box-containing protein
MIIHQAKPRRRSTFRGYAFAVGSVALVVILKILLPDLLGNLRYFLFWPVVILSAWYGGFGPGLVACLLSSAAITFVFPIENVNPADSLLYLVLFIGITAVISGFYQTRKRVEALAQRQQEWLRVTLTSIGDGVIATDSDGKVMFINPVACTLTGWTESDALGKDIHVVFNIVNESTRQSVPIPLMEALKKEVIVGLANHTLLISKDGSERPIMDSGAPIYGADGVMIGAVLVFRDATHQRDATRVQETLELVMSGVNEGFIIFDNDWHFTYANRRAGEMGLEARGRSGEQMLTMTMDEAFPEIIGTNLYQQIKAAAIDKVSRQFQEYIEPYNRWYEYRIYPTSSGLGIFIVDITERQRIEQRIVLLQELTAALTGALTPRDVADIIVDQGFRLFGAQLGSVNLLREDDRLEILRGRGNTPAVMTRFPLLSAKEPTPGADAIWRREPIYIESAAEYEQQYPDLFKAYQAESGTQAVVALPLIVNEQALGSITMGFTKPVKWNQAERAFMMTLAQQTAQALKRALLSERTQEMTAVQERQRLAQDLHDSVSQALFSATTIAQAVPMMWERDPQKAMEQLANVVQINRAAMSEMRILLLELRPQAILKTPLSELLSHLIDAAKGRKMIKADLKVDGNVVGLPPEVHVAFYRIAQESVNNILKHSGAVRFDIRMQYQQDRIILVVEDDGKGFDRAQTGSGMGLSNLQERADGIDATLAIHSSPGDGTTVEVLWMIDEEDGEE